jgi:predicted nucleic acid-binding protein
LSRYALDASVVGKWFLSEPGRERAIRLRNSANDFVAPDLLLPELASLLVKAHRRHMIPASDVLAAVEQVRAVVRLFELDSLIDQAVRLALRFDRSPYDALYVALAVQEQCPLVTADRKLYDAIVPTLPTIMLWIEDVP